MYSGAPVTAASVMARLVASASSSGGRVRPCCTRRRSGPAAMACATSSSMAMPFSACIMVSAPMRSACCMASRISPSVA